MAIQETDILEILKANYQKTIGLMPADLASEFQRRIITPGDLKDFASSILVATQFKDETACLKIQNRVIEQFNYRGFGTKLAQKGVNPTRAYEQLLDGFFDYK